MAERKIARRQLFDCINEGNYEDLKTIPHLDKAIDLPIRRNEPRTAIGYAIQLNDVNAVREIF